MARLASLRTPLAALVLAGLVLAWVSPALAGVVRTGRVEARSTDTWTLWAPSGSSLVVVEGDGDTDLDCYAYDRFGNLLDFDDDLTDYCILIVEQPTSGSIRIQIRNLGAVWNAYVLTLDY